MLDIITTHLAANLPKTLGDDLRIKRYSLFIHSNKINYFLVTSNTGFYTNIELALVYIN